MDNLRIYNWDETIKDKSNRDLRLLNKFPMEFNKKVEDEQSYGNIHGEWYYWELIDESEGRFPVFKCFIKSGIAELIINNKTFNYNLENHWIKICFKLEVDSNDLYYVSEKSSHLYILNTSFIDNKNSIFFKPLIEKIFLNWFKDNTNLLNNHLNLHKISYLDSGNLSLLGWDTTYVTSFTHANKAIEEKAIYPKTFEGDYKDDLFGLECSIKGSWNPWLLGTDAEGKNVSFICSIKPGGKLYVKSSNQEFTLSDNANVKVQVRLEYFNINDKTIEDNTGLGDGSQLNLRIKTNKDVNGNGPVVVLSSYLYDTPPSPLVLDISEAILREWFLDNIDKFEHIFSYFLLNETAKDPNFQWLKPTTAYYGVATVDKDNGEPDLDKSVFGVMSMVENRVNKTPQHTLDSRLLYSSRSSSSFGISTPLFVEKWLESGLVSLQIGTKDQFYIEDYGLTYRNKETIKFGTITNNDGNNVPAYVDPGKFKLGVVNNQIVLDIENLYWEQARGINGHVNFRQSYDITLQSGVDQKGKSYKNVLIPMENHDPTMLLSYSIEEWKRNENLIIEVTTGLAIGLLVGFIPFTGKVFSKLKSVVTKSFNRVSGRMSAEIGGAVTRELRTIAQEAGENADVFLRRVSQDSMDDIGIFLQGGTASQVVNQVSNAPKDILAKMWSNKFKLTGGIVAGAVGGMIPTVVIQSMDHLAQKEFSKLPAIDSFISTCVGTTKWPSSSEFKLESAQLRGVFLLGGSLIRNKMDRD